METKFTKGPWRFSGGEAVYGSDDILICETNLTLQRPDGAWGANSNLIASAPDLYAALEKAKKQIHVFANSKGEAKIADSYCQEIDFLLAKARGE